jgi:RNase P subunit RPR2
MGVYMKSKVVLLMKRDFCNICQKITDQEAKEYPVGTNYKCSICGSKLFIPAKKFEKEKSDEK